MYANRFEQARFVVMVIFVGATFLFGGASRLDVTSLLLLQPLAVLCAAAFLMIPGPIDWRRIKAPLLLLAALAAIMTVQLVPLPPSVWANLPGHEPFVRSAVAAGIAQPWRPMTLAPDLTLASLVGLAVPLAALLGFAALPLQRTYGLLTVLLIGTVLSILLGAAQMAGGDQSPAYLYRITNAGVPVGFFANRNHQAVFLAMSLPMLAVWAVLRQRDGRNEKIRLWVCVGFAVLVLAMVLVSGSRAGLLLTMLGFVFAALSLRRSGRVRLRLENAWQRWAAVAAFAAVVVAILAVFLSSRDVAMQRLLGFDADREVRLEFVPVLLELAKDFFPVGSGFGSFVPVFGFYEPFELLRTTYLNQAHSDPLELIITAGLPGALAAGCFLAWLGATGYRAWMAKGSSRLESFARLGSAMIVIVLLGSLVDYPLRTPLLAVIAAIACGWMASGSGATSETGASSRI